MGMAEDPVCRMMVEPKMQIYHLCVWGCKMAFDKDQEKHLKAARGGGARHHGH